MTSHPPPRLYDDLAWVWELMVNGEDYRSEADLVAETLAAHVTSGGNALLDVGCGAGHHDRYLKQRFEVMGVDFSPRMLELARGRNPDLLYEVGDMRALQLSRRFDAVVILDAIAYCTTYAELEATLEGCVRHLKPGGCILFYLEDSFSFREHFRPTDSVVSTHHRGETEVTVVETSHDPDQDDTHYEYTFVYLIRRPGEALAVEVDRHRMGLFEQRDVDNLLARLGLETNVSRWPFSGAGGGGQGPLYVCRKPSEAAQSG